MTYLQQIENELRTLLSGSTDEGIIAWVKERILESYRNGQAQPKSAARSFSSQKPAVKAPDNLPR